MSNPKNQHFVPRFYLNAFASPDTAESPDPKIWALSTDIRGKEQFLTSTRNVASEKYLYSPLITDTDRDFRFESKLADLEGVLSRLWKELQTSCIALTDGHRKGMALFVANLYLRHPRKRKIAKAFLSSFQSTIGQLFQYGGESQEEVVLLKDGKEFRISREDFESGKATNDNDFHRHFVDYVDSNTMVVAKELLDRRWNVIVSPSSRFITSDNPVILHGPDDRSFGVATKGTSILVPLTPDKLLCIDDRDGPRDTYKGMIPFPGEVTESEALFNFVTFGNAYRFIFGPSDLYPVLESGLRSSENLRQADRTDPLFYRRDVSGDEIKVRRNDPCYCGSGLKYKKCHLKLEHILDSERARPHRIINERNDLYIPD